MFRHRPHRRKSNDGFRTVSILPVPADGIAIFGSPAKKSNIALMPRQPHCRTVPNRTGRPSATISVPADGALKTYRGGRRRQNHRYAVVYRPGNFVSAAKKAGLPSADGRRDCPTNRRYVGGALNIFGHRRQFDTSGKFRRIVRHTFPPAAANTSAIDLPAPAPGISGLSVGKGIFKLSPHIAVNGGINGNAGRFGAVFSASSQIRRLNASSLRTQS